MGFNGYLIQIGSYDTFFEQYIQYQSYKVSRKIQDLDSYRDANGVLHRNVLDHESFVIEMTLRPLNNIELQNVMDAIRQNYISEKERKVSITFYMPEINGYITQEAYMPDPDTPIRRIEGPLVFYEPIQLKFIGY